MKTKQQAIQEAYGEHWEIVKYFIDDNGWIDAKKLDWNFMPPRSCVRGINNTWAISDIQLIENNNGWIKIESEDDLPKERTICWVKDKNQTDLICGEFLNNSKEEKEYWLANSTHYQPIEKPKPPIY